MSGPTREPPPKKGPTTNEKFTLLRGGREAMQAVDNVTSNLPTRLAALQDAKNTADPAAIRASVAQVATMRSILDVARTSLERAMAAAPPGERERFAGAMAKATAQMAKLDEPIERAQRQALLLETTRSGALSELPTGAMTNDPEENRARAAQLAPLGLCDDPTMQSPTSPVCHLDVPQREALREKVASGIAKIADNWRAAATDAQVKERLKPLFKKSGLHPVVDILLQVAMSWLTGQVGGLVVSAIGGARNIQATRSLERAVDTVSLQPLPMPGLSAKAPELSKAGTDLIRGVASKLTDRALKPGSAARSGSDALFLAIGNVVSEWRDHAAGDIRQLPDPELVAVADGLARTDYRVEHFLAKLEKLLASFEQIEQIGVASPQQREPLLAVRVVHPSGVTRMALARHGVDVIDNPGLWIAREPGEEQYERRNGTLVFESWVDGSLTAFALARSPKQIPMLMAADPRWQDANHPKLARWREQPDHDEDVHMLKPDITAAAEPGQKK